MGLYPLYDRLIQPSSQLASEMAHRGVRFDADEIKKSIKKHEAEKVRIAEEIYKEVGRKFNITSSPQIGEVVYPFLGISEDDVGLTNGGKLSTDKKDLERIANRFPLVKKIVEYRHLDHDISNYLLKPLDLMDSNGIIHPHWNSVGTKTGRWTCTNPALQTYTKSMKNTIIPRPGNIIIDADYKQAEMRILAYYSGDPVLLKAVAEGLDLHSANGAAFFGYTFEKFLKGVLDGDPHFIKLRKVAKNLGFLLVYHGQEYAIMRLIGCSKTEASKIRENYFRGLTKVMPWSDKIVRQVKTKGFVQSAYGRIRHFNDIDFVTKKTLTSKNGRKYQTYADPRAYDAEKEAPNAIIQGTSVDLVNFNLIRTHRELKKIGGFTILEVHDSGVFEVPEKHVDTAIQIIKEGMVESVYPVDIKMEIDIGVGYNYRDLKEAA